MIAVLRGMMILGGCVSMTDKITNSEPEHDQLYTLAHDWVVLHLGPQATCAEVARMASTVRGWFERDPAKAAKARAELSL